MKYLNATCMVTLMVTFAFIVALPANAENIKVTPLGSHKGEFCFWDRALIFEDPGGARILYDPGRTVIGATDPRLGNIKAVLVTHLHGDHVGDWHFPRVNSGDCGSWKKPKDWKNDLPITNAAYIAKKKEAVIVTGSKMSEKHSYQVGSIMPNFFKSKLGALGGDPKKSMQETGKVCNDNEDACVTITTVPAVHPNSVEGGMIEGELGNLLSKTKPKLTAYGGPATGYVLTFSNKLKVYLSGDTGITAEHVEQNTKGRQSHGAKLVVMNINNPYATEPDEAVKIIKLIKPVSVIVSHAKEAATTNGRVNPDTKTDKFIKAIDASKEMEVKVHIPLSGKTMEFNSAGNCVAGC